jgi:hypothetical protein
MSLPFCAKRVRAISADRRRECALESVARVLLKAQIPFERGGAIRIR